MEKLFIGGEYVASSASDVIEVENPATEEVIAEVPDASAADVDRAVGAARRAQREWRQVDGLERASLMHRCAAQLEEHADELAVLLTREGGKTLKENRDEIDWSVTAFRHLGEVSARIARAGGRCDQARAAELRAQRTARGSCSHPSVQLPDRVARLAGRGRNGRGQRLHRQAERADAARHVAAG